MVKPAGGQKGAPSAEKPSAIAPEDDDEDDFFDEDDDWDDDWDDYLLDDDRDQEDAAADKAPTGKGQGRTGTAGPEGAAEHGRSETSGDTDDREPADKKGSGRGGIHFDWESLRSSMDEDEDTDEDAEDGPISAGGFLKNFRNIFRGESIDGEKQPLFTPQVLTYIIIIAAVLIGMAGIILGTRYWKFRGYAVTETRTAEDTRSASYCNADGKILRYSTDGASLYKRTGDVIWDISYTMGDPNVSICDDKIAIYDRSGASIVVCDAKGLVGTAATSLPIARAKVSGQGNVAAILQDASGTWVKYYKAGGDEIAEIKTAIDDPGYPLDLAISRNGETLCVSYLSISETGQQAVVDIYSFGSAGQNAVDNRIGHYTYGDIIIPEEEFLDGYAFVAFREDGFSVYSGSRMPSEDANVKIDQDILSVFHNNRHIGLIVRDEEQGGYRMLVYDSSGSQEMDKHFDFVYQEVEITGDEVSLYNGQNICLITLDGVEKFNGQYKGSRQDIFAMGSHRFIVVRETSLELIRLR